MQITNEKIFNMPYWDSLCPSCKTKKYERTKGTIGDWVREYTCNNCGCVFEYNEGDKMGGQFDIITILKF